MIAKLALLILPISAIAQTNHNDANEHLWLSTLNQTLREAGIYASCDISQSGRYTANPGWVSPPSGWLVLCNKDLRLSWQPHTINGSSAISYIVSYRRSLAGDSQWAQVHINETSITLNIAEPDAYEIRVEAIDENGNTEYISFNQR